WERARDERGAVDRSGVARRGVPVVRRYEARAAARQADWAGRIPRSLPAVHRADGGARRPRPDPAEPAACPSRSDTAGGRRARDHHDRRDRHRAFRRRRHDGADPARRRHPGGVRRLRSLARGATASGDRPMTFFYGWVIVAVGMVVTCVGFGSMMALTVFLQPIAQAMGWSRTGIATASLLNFLSMAVGTFAWGALSARFGPGRIIGRGGISLGLGPV